MMHPLSVISSLLRRFLGPVALACAAGMAVLASPAAAQKTPDTRLDTGDPPGAADSRFPQMAAQGNLVYVTWEDDRNGATDIYFNRSLDAAATWLAAPARLDTGSPAGMRDSRNPQIAASGNSVYVAWEDDRNGPTDIYFNRSLDGGASWLASDVRLNTGIPAGSAAGLWPAIACSGNAVYVAWQDFRNGKSDIYVNRSTDGGTTWLPSASRVNTNTAGSFDSFSPSVAASANAVIVVWLDARDGYQDLYGNRSLDNGATWLVSDVRLNTGTSPGTAPAWAPQVVLWGNTACVTWEDHRDGAADIYFNRSLDTGATWLPSDVRLDTGSAPGGAQSYTPRIALSGTMVCVTWEDDRNGASDIYANRSADTGTTWLGADVRLDTGDPPGAGLSTSPDIAAAGDEMFVAWADTRNGADDVYFNRSADGGATWLAQDHRLDTGSAPGSAFSGECRVQASPGAVYTTWADQRNGSFLDIYANIALGFQRYGTGKIGCGGYLPLLLGSGSAEFGQTVSLDVTSGLGAAGGILLLGIAQASIPLGGGTLLVAPPMTMLPFNLGGSPGTCGAGTGSYPIGIPNNPLLAGLAFYFQALFLDPGTAGGVSMTNGVAMWIG